MFDVETALIGACLGNPGSIDRIAISGADFSEPFMGDIFDAMLALTNAGKVADFITISTMFPKHQVFLAKAMDYSLHGYAIEEYASILSSNAIRRRLVNVGAALANLEHDLSNAELVDRARQLVDDAVGSSKAKIRLVRDVLPIVEKKLESREMFLPSPWPDLNAAIGGFRPGAVYVIAARPGVGKTVIAGQIATTLSQHGYVSFSSLEMTETELVSRIIAEQLDIRVAHLNDARLTPVEKQILSDKRKIISDLLIAIDDRSGINPAEIRQFVRTVSRHGHLVGAIVDYLQLLTSTSKMERHNQVAEFSRQLKVMASDFRIPVIALSQLNRNVEGRSDAVPRLSDLRESGAIEQDADVVMLLRRDGFFPHEELVVDIAKNRHGETGEVRLLWDGQYSRAVNK